MSQKCSELDAHIPGLVDANLARRLEPNTKSKMTDVRPDQLGVSKAVLENVIFCHQVQSTIGSGSDSQALSLVIQMLESQTGRFELAFAGRSRTEEKVR